MGHLILNPSHEFFTTSTTINRQLLLLSQFASSLCAGRKKLGSMKAYLKFHWNNAELKPEKHWHSIMYNSIKKNSIDFRIFTKFLAFEISLRGCSDASLYVLNSLCDIQTCVRTPSSVIQKTLVWKWHVLATMIKKLIYKVVLKEISLEIILHAIQKSHFPFPYKTGIGNCNDSCLLRLSEEKNTSATVASNLELSLW